MPINTPKWIAGPYYAADCMILTGTVDHLPYMLASVQRPLPGVNIDGDPEKTAQLLAAAPDLYAALSFADLLIDTVARKAPNMGTVLADCFAKAHAKASAALLKANPATKDKADEF